MGTRTDILRIKLTQTGDGQVKASIAGVEKSIKRVDRSIKKTDKSAAKLGRNLKSMKGTVAAIATGFAARYIASTIVEFERLQASLKTVTGSTDAANKVWRELNKFTAETPFQLEEVVRAYIKLKALGLDPSIEALRSYGNTASAMSLSVNQMIEAVADAATGEFERLKEFGIKARTQGEKVTFIFRGVSTTVKKTASEIEGYLRTVGDQQFAGAMEEQMATLGGSFSNLADAISKTVERISGSSGFTDALKDSTGALTNFLNRMEANNSIEGIEKRLARARAEVEKFADTDIRVTKWKQAVIRTQNELDAALLRQGGTKAAAINFRLAKEEAERLEKVLDRLANNTDVNPYVSGEAYANRIKEQLEQARQQMEAAKAAMESTGGDDGASDKGTNQLSVAQQMLADKLAKVRKGLEQQVATYGESSEAILKYRLTIGDLSEAVSELGEVGVAAQEELLALAETLSGKREEDEATAYQEQLLSRYAALEEYLMTEDELWADNRFNQQMLLDEALEDKLISYDQYYLALEKMNEKHLARQQKLEKRHGKTVSNMKKQNLQQGLALLEMFAGKNKAVAIAVLAIQKGLAIAETIAHTQVAAMRAIAELGPIAGPPVAAAIEAAGAVSVGLIAAQGIVQAGQIASGGGAGGIGGASQPTHQVDPYTGVPQRGGDPDAKEISITLQGDSFSRDQVNDLIEAINDAVDDGAELKVAAA